MAKAGYCSCMQRLNHAPQTSNRQAPCRREKARHTEDCASPHGDNGKQQRNDSRSCAARKDASPPSKHQKNEIAHRCPRVSSTTTLGSDAWPVALLGLSRCCFKGRKRRGESTMDTHIKTLDGVLDKHTKLTHIPQTRPGRGLYSYCSSKIPSPSKEILG